MTKKEIADHLQMIERNLSQLQKQTDDLMYRVIKCETIKTKTKTKAEDYTIATLAGSVAATWEGPTLLEVLQKTIEALDKFNKNVREYEANHVKSKFYKKFTKRIIV